MVLIGPVGIGSMLYLTAAPDLPAGHEIATGHWSREVLSWPLARSGVEGHQELTPEATHVLLELTWEAVRLHQFPDRPRRLDCLFLWGDEATARAWHYRKHFLRAAYAGLYAVEVITLERVFAADMNLISYIDPGDTLGVLWERARRYWQGECDDVPPEILLEGRVKVRRNLLAIPLEALDVLKDPRTNRMTPAAVGWQTSDPAPFTLILGHGGRYHLHGTLVADESLPVPIAGWIAVEVDGHEEPVLARRGTPPLLLKPADTCRASAAFTDLPLLSKGGRCRPVLVCDRAAAYYWQVQPYWEGRIRGDWLIVKPAKARGAGREPSSEQEPPHASSRGSHRTADR